MTLSTTDLVTQGLPVGFSLRSAGAIKSDLSTWKVVDFDEYAYGVERGTDRAPLAHDAWTFVHRDRRYVVPALVLMRAIVQYDAELFKKLFQAQSLEDICCPGTSDVESAGHIVVDSRFKRASKRKTPGLSAQLSWLYSFPSARRCWASAYQSAKQGRLGLTLPAATLTFSLCGAHFRTSGNVYVTQLSLVEIEAMEEPLPFASDHPRQISVRQIPSKSEEELDAQLALATKLEISEDIWHAVEPILARSKGRGPKADHRKKFGCVLQVISAGSTWSVAARIHKCSVGTAAEALSRWKQDGRWSEVTRELRQFGISL